MLPLKIYNPLILNSNNKEKCIFPESLSQRIRDKRTLIIKRPDLRMHDMRHITGSRIFALTGDLKATQNYLSHGSIEITLRYAKNATQKSLK